MNRIKKFAAVAALLAAVTFGMQACGDDAQGILLALGIIEGPSAADTLTAAQNGCTVNCDGELDDLSAGVKGPPPEEGDYDDDYDALLRLIGFLWLGYDGDAFDAFFEFMEDRYPEGYPEGPFSYGPLSARIDLSDACGPGTGSVIATFFGDLDEEDLKSHGKGFVGDHPPLDVHEIFTLSLSNCTVEGNITGGGTELVTLSGNATFSRRFGDDVDEEFTVTGNIRVNPGAVAPTGEATRIWGFDETITIDFILSDAFVMNPPGDGSGVCYGGTDASSEEDCDGIFMDGEQAFWHFYD